MTLRTKTSLLLALVITAALGVTGIFYLQFLEKSLKLSIFSGVEGLSDTSAHAISKFLDDTLREAQAVAHAIPVEALEKKDARLVEERLKTLLKIFPKFQNGMFVLDAEGRLWADYPAHPKVRGRLFDFREYFQRTMREKRGIIGVPYRSARTGEPVLTFTAFLHGSSSQVLGLLGCSVQILSPSALGGIRKTGIGRLGYIYVYDTTRLMILHPQDDRVLKRDVPPGVNKLFDAALEGFEGVGETVNSRGIPMLLSLRRIPGTDWIIGAQQPKSEAYAPLKEARRRIIYGIILAALFTGLIGAVAIRRITEPLARLRRAVMQLGLGEGEGNIELQEELEGIRAGDEIGELASVFKDISGRLDQTLLSLRKSASDWERTFDAVPDLIAILDDGYRIVRLNKAMADALGMSPQEVVGMKCYQVFHGTNEPPGFCPHRKMLEDGREHTVEFYEEHLDRDLSITTSPLRNAQGVLIGSVHVARDVSERRSVEDEKARLEVQLQRAQKMEAIGTLAGGVAHDLNNILSGLVSYPELILLDLPEESPLRDPIITIQESGKKAATIVQDMLTLARRGVTITEVVNLNDTISEYLGSPVCAKLKSFHPNVWIKTELDPDLINVKGSPVHLSKIIMNLVANAAEAMPAGGDITVTTENRYVDRPIQGYDDVEEGDYVVLGVSDTGIGISAKDLKRIFEPFYTKKVMGRSGTGLGMAVVWSTVKDHKGYIDVQSVEGEGTRIDLYFPVTRQHADSPEARVSIEDYLGDEKILVIDDIREQREIASKMLGKLGYRVEAVSSGEEAVEYLKSASADLLILDMIMDPGIDGLETYRRISELNSGQRAIIASGFSETDRVREAQRLGAGAYLKKPYTLENLGVAVRKELDR